ncbi:MAG: hypothetical protein LC099_00060 [Anaerolineales bacterium]|nr:hypothetical protein [Anaerolineales bacterium]
MSKTISAGRTPTIKIESVGGDLSLVGWEGEDILLKADNESLSVTQDGDQVSVSCADDLSLRAPKGANVLIERVEGGASIRGVLGNIELKEALGDLSIRDAANVTVGSVGADFSLRGAKGNLFVRQAGAEVAIRDVDGDIRLDSVAEDLALRDARGNISANVGEDVALYLKPQAGNSYSIHAGDDILLVMPPKTGATLALSADLIAVEWDGVENEDDSASRVLTLGDGAAQIALSAGGDIRVSNRADAGESAADFGNFAGMSMDWSGLGEAISRQVSERINEKIQQKMGQIEEKMRGRGKTRFASNSWSWSGASKGVPASPPNPKATDEERLMILQMLQDKKISAEDAEKLLAALEGDS